MNTISFFDPESFPGRCWAFRSQHGRPFVTLSYAQSLDGSIAIRRGQPVSLSGPEALKLTHGLRAVHDAILVGIGTVISDSPRLTVRLAQGSNPQPVVLDSTLRFPLETGLVKNESVCPWIFTTERADPENQRRLEEVGLRVIRGPADARGRVDLHAALAYLSDWEINSLMVEGGAEIITSFMTERLVDHIVVTISPVFLGSLKAIEQYPGHIGAPSQIDDISTRIANMRWLQAGRDIIIQGGLAWPQARTTAQSDSPGGSRSSPGDGAGSGGSIS